MVHRRTHNGLKRLEFEELDQKIKDLFVKAHEQLDHSYAPYSDFNVGSALLLDNDQIVVGCNQENASYPLCMCAERVALYNAGSTYPNRKITAIVIICRNNKKQLSEPGSPCGACRQVIHEFGFKQNFHFPIYLKVVEKSLVYRFDSIEVLLPFSFNRTFLQ